MFLTKLEFDELKNQHFSTEHQHRFVKNYIPGCHRCGELSSMLGGVFETVVPGENKTTISRLPSTRRKK